jgi:hypothetical protein
MNDYTDLSYDEKLDFLHKELDKVKHEINISKLIYTYHDCDSYEDIFRDNIPLLENKMKGILIAIENLKMIFTVQNQNITLE